MIRVLGIAAGVLWAAGPASAGEAHEYLVHADAPTLFEIAVDAYGDSRKWRKIAEWNGIVEPYVIHVGQRLVLREPPVRTPAEGDATRLAFWRERFGLTGAPKTDAAQPEPAPSGSAPATYEDTAAEFERRRAGHEAADGEPSAADFFEKGMRSFGRGRRREALGFFRKGRELDGAHLPSWFYELKVLRELGRDADAEELQAELLRSRPELASLPMFGRP